MGIPAANASWVLSEFSKRLGDPYVYGGVYAPSDTGQGCDCSGEVGWVLEALTRGPAAMSWAHVVSTESWPFDYSTNFPAQPGTVGPYGTVAVLNAADAPPDAALIINIMHGGGGADSHMNCQLSGQYLESNGTYGSCTGAKAGSDTNSEWTDHWYLPGPIDGTGTVTEPTDTIFADVSEFQVRVDDSYPYQVLSIRVCDGVYQDHNFAENYAWMRSALDSGKLTMGIVYTYVRPDWQSTANTLRNMFGDNGGLHPKVVLMLDVESGGNPGGDGSTWVDALYDNLVDFTGDARRVIGYGNVGDLNNLWITKPNGERLVVASYGSNPTYPGEIAHQYTDGQGYGGGLPEGCPPFGNCDMNSADGLSPSQFAAVCGIDSAPLGGFLMALSDAQQQQIYDKLTTTWRSRSAFRHWGEGPVDDTVGIELNDDGMEHVQLIIKLAEYGDPQALALLAEVANGDLTVEPTRAADKALAQRVLARLAVAPVSAAPVAAVVSEVAPVAPVAPEPVPVPVSFPVPAAVPGFLQSIEAIAQLIAKAKG